MKCPGFQVLTDYLDSRLDPTLCKGVRAHLASQCGQCNADLAWYGAVKLIAAGDDSVEPPQWVLKRAFRIFQASPSQDRLVARAGRLVASLIFDSFARHAMAGARSADMSDRQMLYRAAGFGMDLQITSAERSRASIIGQILCEGEFAFESVKRLSVTLLSQGTAVASTFTNNRGEFSVTSVDRGEYDLQIEAGSLMITIIKMNRQKLR